MDITTTVASDCSEGGDFNFTESATFAIDRSSPRGSEHVEGSTQSSSSHALEAQDFTKSTALDVTRTRTDADGNTEVVRLSGNLGVAFDASGALPLRTVGGTLSLTLPSGDAVQATLNGVVREPPRVCRTPVGGTIDYADPDGTAHSLSFGPDCGAATLDGEALTLEQTGPGDAARGP